MVAAHTNKQQQPTDRRVVIPRRLDSISKCDDSFKAMAFQSKGLLTVYIKLYSFRSASNKNAFQFNRKARFLGKLLAENASERLVAMPVTMLPPGLTVVAHT